ncbi:MAG: carboxypeptidase regulatory-like domain-containing protein [Chitinophagaceae bacterium]
MSLKRILSCCCLLLLHCAHAQTGTIKGFVKDSLTGIALESATVSVYSKDSTLLNYQLSDANGNFTITRIPMHKPVRLTVSYISYRSFARHVVLDSAIASVAVLMATADDSNNVVVTSNIPIRMNGDTLEINPAAFKMDPNAVVEELLNQVPGTTIWADGMITINGKEVKNLLVDGKPFLGMKDNRIATQNLPKNAIEKIQVYQEYDRTKIDDPEKGPKDSLLTMNIKLKKEAQHGYFGKAGAGFGTSSRFETDLSLQAYNKTSSLGIGGGYNNINKNIDNLQEMFQNNTYRNYNPNLYNVGRFGRSGINKNYSIGAAATHNFIETTNNRQNNRLTLNYNHSGADVDITNLTLQTRTTPGNQQFITEQGKQNRSSNRHEVGLNYIKTNSYSDEFTIVGSARTSNDTDNGTRSTETRDSANNLKSTNDVGTVQDSKSNNQSINVAFSKNDYDNPLLGFRASANITNSTAISNRFVTSNFDSYTDNTADTSYNRHYNTENKSLNAQLNFNYRGLRRLLFGRFNCFGIDMSLNQDLNFGSQSENVKVADYNKVSPGYLNNDRLSNTNELNKLKYSPALSLSKYFSKYNMKGSKYINFGLRLINDFIVDKNQSSIANRNLNRSFSFLRYDGYISLQSNRQKQYSSYLNVNYQKNFEYPDINRLYPVVDDIDAYNIRRGNPGLVNVITHQFSFNTSYSMEKPQSLYGFNVQVNGNYSLSKNPVTDSAFNDPSGKRVSYNTNADKSNNYSLNYHANLSRKIQNSIIQLMYNGSFSNNRIPNYIDNLYTISENINLFNQLTLQLSLRSFLILNMGKTLTNYRTKQTGAGLTSYASKSDITRFGATVNFSKNLTFNSTLDYTKNTGIANRVMLWNAFASCRFMKQQGELKFSAMDILKEFQNISNSVNSYGTTVRSSNGLQQYFLLTFSYYPRKFVKAEVKRR